MINQNLIDLIKSKLDSELEVETEFVCSLLDSYISLIEQNAELHKELAKSKADYNKLYEICINSGINKNIVDMNMRLGNAQT